MREILQNIVINNLTTDGLHSYYNWVMYTSRAGETESERKARLAAYQKEYYADPTHRTAALDRSKRLYEERKEQIKVRAREYAALHREELAAYRACPERKARVAEKSREYHSDPVKRARNAELRRARMVTPDGKRKKLEKERRYRHNHPGAKRRQHAKRRALGLVPLNQCFDGCEGHHIDREHVIYIPKELHRSIQRNVWTGSGMEEINTVALAWVREAEKTAA